MWILKPLIFSSFDLIWVYFGAQFQLQEVASFFRCKYRGYGGDHHEAIPIISIDNPNCTLKYRNPKGQWKQSIDVCCNKHV